MKRSHQGLLPSLAGLGPFKIVLMSVGFPGSLPTSAASTATRKTWRLATKRGHLQNIGDVCTSTQAWAAVGSFEMA